MVHFLRGFIFFIKLTILVALGVLLAQHPGEAHLTWFGYRLDMSMGILLGGVLFGVALILLIVGAWRSLWRLPLLWAERRKKGRRRKNQATLIEGLSAIAAGEFPEARRLAKRAISLDTQHPLNLFLAGQAAYLSGKLEESNTHFLQMRKNPETAFLGLRGLILQARHTNNWEQMRQLLQEAMGLRPKSPWVLQQLLELDLRLGAFDKASMIVEQMQLRQLISKPESRRRQALIHWMKAEAAEMAGDESLFVQTAASAHYEAPEISTIAVRLAGHYHKIGKISKAQKILTGGYAHCPHPDFASQLTSLHLDTNALDQYREMEKLVEGAPNHPESLYILAKAAKGAKLWGQSRHYLTLLKSVSYSQRVCHLMAEIEEGENPHQANRAHEWRERAKAAPADPTWVCQSCHLTTPLWRPICPSCEGFDQITWRSPIANAATADLKETAPLLG
ncbi:MAG: heme biosynthesis protein HemY [Alphaproteobacteria bacterium]|jgi:HemY protein|nr:heme biosynthesis protein HemY [Alphaproteobacteria bacterium]